MRFGSPGVLREEVLATSWNAPEDHKEGQGHTSKHLHLCLNIFWYTFYIWNQFVVVGVWLCCLSHVFLNHQVAFPPHPDASNHCCSSWKMLILGSYNAQGAFGGNCIILAGFNFWTLPMGLLKRFSIIMLSRNSISCKGCEVNSFFFFSYLEIRYIFVPFDVLFFNPLWQTTNPKWCFSTY